MRIVIQRVKRASVSVGNEPVGSIGTGVVLLLGFGREDSPMLPGSKLWQKMLDKILNLRIFPDNEDKLNLGLVDIEGEVLIVSQFTLYADCKKGRRPGFQDAAGPSTAELLYDTFVSDLKKKWAKVQTGSFGQEMNVSLVNWGPVTILLDSSQM